MFLGTISWVNSLDFQLKRAVRKGYILGRQIKTHNIFGQTGKVLNLSYRFGFVIAVFLSFTIITHAASPEVTKVRIGVHPGKTRLVLETTRVFPYRVFLLGNPYRVVIDLPNILWRAPLPQMKKAAGLVSNYRFGLFRPGNSRVVIDVTGPVKVARHAILGGGKVGATRFFIDLEPVTEVGFETARARVHSRQWKTPQPTAPARRKPKAKARGDSRHVIMIDPGHGGVDPGAIGRRGTFESHVTLSVAKHLKKALEKSGKYIVNLTRNRDIYIPLRDRFDKAEAVKAELFISLHADTIKNPKVRGASVYTLSERASDKEAGALATKENRSDIIAGVDLTQQSDTVASVLISLRQRHTMDESAHFARFMVENLGKSIRLLRNTHRFAGFAVLKSPDVPSVLVELGYLSTKHDEKMLKSKKFHVNVSRAIRRAVDAYFERKERLRKS
jgi:N-acetylmuramoyl-L-alanine amidase